MLTMERLAVESTHEEIWRIGDETARLEGLVALHSTRLGPAFGGCRLADYRSTADMLADVLALSSAMTAKNALAALALGGGKSVIRRPAGAFDRRALFEAFGQAVERLEGRYATSVDVGTTPDDLAHIARATAHVAGLDARYRGVSASTALGVFAAIQAALGPLDGVRVAVQGVGEVGGRLARQLAAAGARLVLADADTARATALADETGAEAVPAEAIADMAVDLFAPCALGRTVTADTRAAVVCGAANNQPASPEVDALLAARGVLYCPDYLVNAGGMTSVAAQWRQTDPARLEADVRAIGPRLTRLRERCRASGRPPGAEADHWAADIVAGRAEAA